VTRLLVLAALVLLAFPVGASALPDLSVSMPATPTDTVVAPVYVDAFEEPGHLVYRFDTLIHNQGTTLDLYRDPSTGHAMQVLWKGDPSPAPDPAVQPSVPGKMLSDRTDAVGAKIEFVTEKSHAHFHFFTAALYEMLVPGKPSRVSGKIGFCLSDAFGGAGGTVQWFDPHRLWCNPPSGQPEFTRMGLSHDAADRYRSQLEFQYVDITGLAPGTYTLRGTANPEGSVLESDGVPDIHEEPRTVPGVVADAAEASSKAAAVTIPLSARATALDIPARRSAACAPEESDPSCYVWATAGAPLRFAVTAPGHGTATVSGSSVSYTPAAGFSGDDRFTFTATDARGLVSAPATVVVHVAAAPQGAPAPVPVPPAAPPAVEMGPRRLLAIVSARRSARRRVTVRLRCLPAAAGACAGQIRLRSGGRPIATVRRFTRLRPGRARTIRIRLSRVPRRAIRIRATVADEAGPGSARHAVVQVHHAVREAAL
jgi:Bacterial Ig domain/Lysyl oxidase